MAKEIPNDTYVSFGRNLELSKEMGNGILIGFAITRSDDDSWGQRSMIVLDRSDLKELINHLSMLMVKDNGTD